MGKRRKGPPRDARGRFVSKKSPSKKSPRKRPIPKNRFRPQQPPSFVRPKRARDDKGRFVSKGAARVDYVRTIEELRREVERLKTEKVVREKDIARNFKRRGGAFDTFVETLALGQRARIEKYLDEVYDGTLSKEDFVTLAVGAGLTVREAWAVLYS